MASKPPFKRPTTKPVDPKQLNHSEFRWFILHFPSSLLRAKRIQRPTFVAVGLALAQFGTYEKGTNVNPSRKALHNLTGAHEDTIRKVLDLLVEVGAIEQVDSHQGSNGGRPYAVYRFRRSVAVEKTLAKRDASDWREVASSSPVPAEQERVNPTGESASPTGESANPTGEDNRNTTNVSNSSVAEAPSPLSSSEDESSQEKDLDDDWSEFEKSIRDLDEKKNQPSMDERWQQLVAEVKR